MSTYVPQTEAGSIFQQHCEIQMMMPNKEIRTPLLSGLLGVTYTSVDDYESMQFSNLNDRGRIMEDDTLKERLEEWCAKNGVLISIIPKLTSLLLSGSRKRKHVTLSGQRFIKLLSTETLAKFIVLNRVKIAEHLIKADGGKKEQRRVEILSRKIMEDIEGVCRDAVIRGGPAWTILAAVRVVKENGGVIEESRIGIC